MDVWVKSLRDQVAAARFLLNSLQTQLTEAENEAARGAGQNNVQQQIGLNHIGNSQSATGPNATVRPNQPTGVQSLDGVPDYAPTGLNDQTGSLDGGGLIFLDNDENDAPGEAALDTNPSFELPSLKVGQLYSSLEDVKAAARAYAVTQGWTCGVHKRDKTRILLKCRSGDSGEACPFFVRAEQYENGARIASYRPKHTCTFQTDQSHLARTHATSTSYMREQLPTFMNLDSETTAREISDAIFERFGTRVSVKQCQKLRPGPKRKRKPSMGTCGRCGAIGHNVKTCGRTME